MKLKIVAYSKIIIVFLLLGNVAWAQHNNEKIGDYYYNSGEYDKAVTYYEEFFDDKKNITSFQKYFDCLLKLEDYKTAEKIAEKQRRKDPLQYNYAIALGKVLELQDKKEEAREVYINTINNVTPTVQTIIKLGTLFKDAGKYEMALKTFERGQKNVTTYPFEIQIADVYAIQGDIGKMVDEYLNLIGDNQAYVRSVQNYLTRYFDFEDPDNQNIDALRVALLRRIQKSPNQTVYNEMLIWLFIQKKDFNSALTQTIALDKRNNENGTEVIRLARMAKQNKAYRMASKAYQYIIDQGEKHQYFITANLEQIGIKYEQLKDGELSKEEVTALTGQYEHALSVFGWQRQTIPLIIEYAEVAAYYANNQELAKELINKAFEIPGLGSTQEAELKILLADILVLENDIWEASLLYMQVEEEFKQDRLGHLAKFKNAKLYYYAGQFDWAKAQLDVLKASTSKLIANDAMQLSLLIADNLNMDTITAPMETFARADLLVQQHRYSQAEMTLDTLTKKYPFHSLNDEILMLKAKMQEQQGNYEKAIEYYLKVYTAHKNDIYADDAVFKIGTLYEEELNNDLEAAEYYKKILFEFKGSLHVIESRKRFREITGNSFDNSKDFKKIEMP